MNDRPQSAVTLVLVRLLICVATLLALASCQSKPYRYCYSSDVEEDGGYFYEFDGGYFYEHDGGYFYEHDGGYFYEYDADRGSNRHAVICRSGVKCSTDHANECVAPLKDSQDTQRL